MTQSSVPWNLLNQLKLCQVQIFPTIHLQPQFTCTWSIPICFKSFQEAKFILCRSDNTTHLKTLAIRNVPLNSGHMADNPIRARAKFGFLCLVSRYSGIWAIMYNFFEPKKSKNRWQTLKIVPENKWKGWRISCVLSTSSPLLDSQFATRQELMN